MTGSPDTRSVSHYLFDGDAWHDYFVPGFEDALGPLWFAFLAARGRRPRRQRGAPAARSLRMVALVGIGSLVAFIFTPQYLDLAPGQAVLLRDQPRYGAAGLALGLLLVRRRVPPALVVVLPAARARHPGRAGGPRQLAGPPVALLVLPDQIDRASSLRRSSWSRARRPGHRRGQSGAPGWPSAGPQPVPASSPRRLPSCWPCGRAPAVHRRALRRAGFYRGGLFPWGDLGPPTLASVRSAPCARSSSTRWPVRTSSTMFDYLAVDFFDSVACRRQGSRWSCSPSIEDGRLRLRGRGRELTRAGGWPANRTRRSIPDIFDPALTLFGLVGGGGLPARPRARRPLVAERDFKPTRRAKHVVLGPDRDAIPRRMVEPARPAACRAA